MKKSLLLSCLILVSQIVYAQCGALVGQFVITSQDDLDELSSCEVFNGDLVISSDNITNVTALSSLSVVSGNFYLLNTSVTDLSPLSSLNNASQVIIQGNLNLISCCELIQFTTAAELGSIQTISISNNGSFCDDSNALMLECLGFIEGCLDSVAVNFNPLATVDDGSCDYPCPESLNDMQDYSCNVISYPETCQAII